MMSFHRDCSLSVVAGMRRSITPTGFPILVMLLILEQLAQCILIGSLYSHTIIFLPLPLILYHLFHSGEQRKAGFPVFFIDRGLIDNEGVIMVLLNWNC